MKIIPDLPVRTTISVIIAVLGFTGTAVWFFANGVRDIKDDIADLRSDIHAQRQEAWTYDDQQRWVSVFAKENRFTNIDIPLIPERDKSKKKPN